MKNPESVVTIFPKTESLCAGLLRLSAVRRQQSDLLHDSWTELTVQLVKPGSVTLGSTASVWIH